MAIDPARQWTDEHLAEMEKHIAQVYRQAQSELTEKWNDYMARGQQRLDDLYTAYTMAPPDKKAEALLRYQEAARNYTLQNQRYREMVDETTYRLAHVNEIAVAYVNGEMPAIYARNFNQIDPEAFLVNTSWTIRDEHTIANLMRDSLPQKTVNVAKDMAWNQRQINSSVLQGIIQGESIPKISKRLMPVLNNNRAAAIRTARTMVTAAENRGRQDRYSEYEAEGILTHKVWIATPDNRVRDWHLSMDGQEVEVNETFTDGHGEALMYPGDPDGSPQTVYNCRCSMRTHMIGVYDRNGKLHKMSDFRSGLSDHDRAIAAERFRRYEEEIEEEYY